jgi:hypothetical protein
MVNFDQYAPGLTIYVDDDGDDVTGDGSAGNPYATIQKGVDVSDWNATIHVMPGTYPAGFSVAGASRYLTIDAPSGGATVTGALVDLSAVAPDPINIWMSGLDFAPAVESAMWDAVVNLSGDSDKRVYVDNCTLTANSGVAVPAFALIGANTTNTGGSLEVEVTNCTIDGAGVSNGIFIHCIGPVTVTDCTVNDVDNGIVKGGQGPFTVERCTVETAIGRGIYAGSHVPWDLGSAEWYDMSGVTTVDRCHIINCGGVYPNTEYTCCNIIFASTTKRVSNCIIEDCNYGFQFGWI